jgi:hypothetical protein
MLRSRIHNFTLPLLIHPMVTYAFTCLPLMIAAAPLLSSQDTHTYIYTYINLVLKKEQTQISTSPKATSDQVLCVLFSPGLQSRQAEPGVMG